MNSVKGQLDTDKLGKWKHSTIGNKYIRSRLTGTKIKSARISHVSEAKIIF